MPPANSLPSGAATTLAPLLATSLPGAPTIAAGLLGALVAIAALSFVFRRRPETLPLLAIFALPFRLPISAGGRTVNLLIPLYLVVAAGTLTLLLPRLLGRPAGAAPIQGDSGSTPGTGRSSNPLSKLLSPNGLQSLLLVAVVLYSIQAAYSPDPGKAAENVAFFYVPFGLLFLLLRDVAWTRALLLRCLYVAAALGVVFAGIGFVEYSRKSLFLNPKVVAADQYGNYFRVNSLFFDPNIYGRFLAIVMVAIVAVVLWTRSRRSVWIAAAVLAWLLAGLITSFSQSSIAALLLGMAVLAAYRWDFRSTVYVAASLAAIALVVVLAAPPSLHFGLTGSGGSTSNATSGRTKLISGGLELFADRPLYGYGSGSFETEYRRHGNASSANATSASHTIPITVAAEQGLLGLAVYVALLISAFAVLGLGAGRSPPRIALLACFAALVLHTWTYADFLEDPITWTLLGIGVAFARIGALDGGSGSAAIESPSLAAGPGTVSAVAHE
jgi:O-antigen ligase